MIIEEYKLNSTYKISWQEGNSNNILPSIVNAFKFFPFNFFFIWNCLTAYESWGFLSYFISFLFAIYIYLPPSGRFSFSYMDSQNLKMYKCSRLKGTIHILSTHARIKSVKRSRRVKQCETRVRARLNSSDSNSSSSIES